MARLNKRVLSSNPREHTVNLQPAPIRSSSNIPSSPTESSGSDKENHHHRPGGQSRTGKRKSGSISMSSPATRDTGSGNKRRKTERRQPAAASQGSRRQELREKGDTSFYDPDQDEDTKRDTKKKIRSLATKVNDSRAEYLQRDSRGIQDALTEADQIYKDVKQTSVATIDSRLLVNVGDLAYKKVNTLALGDSSTGVDVDDFISKCISFMKRGDNNSQDRMNSQRRQQQQRQGNEDDEDETLDLNWSYLGRNACFLYNARPCLSGFLLGPLSVQKKVRQQTQRKATQVRTDGTQAIRPIELTEEDLDQQESASLTLICQEIAGLLRKTVQKGQDGVEAEVEEFDNDPTPEQVRSLMHKHSVSDDGGVPLFNFCVNPRSFGQTVENFFYVSFLIKEGKVGLGFDSDEMPTLQMADPKTIEERQERPRNQAVFALDFETWEDLIESCGITRSIIPHRDERQWDDGTLSYRDPRPEIDGEEDPDMYGPS